MALGIRFYSVPQVAQAFLCSTTTVKRWVREGLLLPRYQVLSGRCYRLVFSEAELERFAIANFPEPSDLDPTHMPRSSKKKAEMVRRLVNMHRLYAGKATAARMVRDLAKECGLEVTELEAQEKEPVIMDQRPRRKHPHLWREAQSAEERKLSEDREEDER